MAMSSPRWFQYTRRRTDTADRPARVGPVDAHLLPEALDPLGREAAKVGRRNRLHAHRTPLWPAGLNRSIIRRLTQAWDTRSDACGLPSQCWAAWSSWRPVSSG